MQEIIPELKWMNLLLAETICIEMQTALCLKILEESVSSEDVNYIDPEQLTLTSARNGKQSRRITSRGMKSKILLFLYVI